MKTNRSGKIDFYQPNLRQQPPRSTAWEMTREVTAMKGGGVYSRWCQTCSGHFCKCGFLGFFCTLFENMVWNHLIWWWHSWTVVWVSFFLSLCYLMDYFISLGQIKGLVCPVAPSWSSQRFIHQPALRKCYSWSRLKGGDLVVITEGSEICGWRYLEMEDRARISTAGQPFPEGKPLWNGLFAVWLWAKTAFSAPLWWAQALMLLFERLCQNLISWSLWTFDSAPIQHERKSLAS